MNEFFFSNNNKSLPDVITFADKNIGSKVCHLKYAEMFEQDLNAEKNQDDTSGKLCFRFVSCPEYVSDFYTCGSMINVITPINETAGIICTFKKAKVMPTARASILVATARGNIVLQSKRSFEDSSSPEKLRGSY